MKHALWLGSPFLLLLGSCASLAPVLESIFDPEVAPAVEATAREASYDPAAWEVRWKERLGQGYVFAERRGDYRELAPALAELGARAAAVSDFELAGSPFLLLFDDPGSVPVSELRARVCLPVDRRLEAEGLRFDVLPTDLVVYARIDERATQALRVVPDLMREIDSLGGEASGPVRVVLLPAAVDARPRTEVQVPWSRAAQ